MDNVTGIIRAIYRGFVDSLRGAIVLFYMDKRINEKLLKQPSSKEIQRKDIVVATPPQKHFNQLRESEKNITSRGMYSFQKGDSR